VIHLDVLLNIGYGRMVQRHQDEIDRRGQAIHLFLELKLKQN